MRKLTDYQMAAEHFATRHKEVMHGVPYMALHPRDAKMLKPVLETYGLAATCEMVRYFFEEVAATEAGDADNWIGRATPSVPGFIRQIPSIIKHYTLEAFSDAEESRPLEKSASAIVGRPREVK